MSHASGVDPGTGRIEPRPGSARIPAVMGILNCTPDSFSDGGQFAAVEAAHQQALAIAHAGGAILDVGGESTRPGSREVTVDEEISRVLPLLDALPAGYPLPISIDTRRAAVAERAISAGATILNDTAALRDDPELAPLAAEHDVTVILMHRRGVPETMQVGLDESTYDDVVDEVRAFFDERVQFALDAGIDRTRIVLDPGIGFGKRAEDNDRLLASLDRLRLEGIPLLVGASRKAFLARFDDRAASDRLPGSLAVAARCAEAGVEVIRVHDVPETVAFLRTWEAIGGGVCGEAEGRDS